MSENPQFIQSEYERLKEAQAQNIYQLLINVYGAEAVSNWMVWKAENANS